jgi:hypothetical protein
LEPLVEGAARFGLLILVSPELQLHHESTVHFHADVDAIEVQEAAHHQPGADQEDQGQRDLDDDHGAGEPADAAAAGVAAAAFLEHPVHVGA